MIAPRDDRRDRGDDSVGIIEHLPVVESEHDVTERHERLIPSKICPAVGRLSVMSLAIALDEQAVADEQIGTCEVTDREWRLRRCVDARVAQQHTQHALCTRLGALIGERRGGPRLRPPARCQKLKLDRGQRGGAKRRVENRHREGFRQVSCHPLQHARQRCNAELRFSLVSRPMDANLRAFGTLPAHGDGNASFNVQLGVGY